eukprot:CAMPEP_0178987868 /NCGR_PEP_ID=MMETSP0795-20121207/3506_1 /TAXON_ID=88552 /ORGANISM="Amoebophrya sp., Strain Ameob2" /LENGTH=633 /DNA_ID=CAMNT_0020679103 /DNA_START=48 /DNA_END=1949 /DNA_ORIENTATION=+
MSRPGTGTGSSPQLKTPVPSPPPAASGGQRLGTNRSKTSTGLRGRISAPKNYFSASSLPPRGVRASKDSLSVSKSAGLLRFDEGADAPPSPRAAAGEDDENIGGEQEDQDDDHKTKKARAPRADESSDDDAFAWKHVFSDRKRRSNPAVRQASSSSAGSSEQHEVAASSSCGRASGSPGAARAGLPLRGVPHTSNRTGGAAPAAPPASLLASRRGADRPIRGAAREYYKSIAEHNATGYAGLAARYGDRLLKPAAVGGASRHVGPSPGSATGATPVGRMRQPRASAFEKANIPPVGLGFNSASRGGGSVGVPVPSKKSPVRTGDVGAEAFSSSASSAAASPGSISPVVDLSRFAPRRPEVDDELAPAGPPVAKRRKKGTQHDAGASENQLLGEHMVLAASSAASSSSYCAANGVKKAAVVVPPVNNGVNVKKAAVVVPQPQPRRGQPAPPKRLTRSRAGALRLRAQEDAQHQLQHAAQPLGSEAEQHPEIKTQSRMFLSQASASATATAPGVVGKSRGHLGGQAYPSAGGAANVAQLRRQQHQVGARGAFLFCSDPAVPAPSVVQEYWVGCDACGKWRRVDRESHRIIEEAYGKTLPFVCDYLQNTSCLLPDDAEVGPGIGGVVPGPLRVLLR